MRLHLEMSKKEKWGYGIPLFLILVTGLWYFAEVYKPIATAERVADCVADGTQRSVAQARSMDELLDNIPGQHRVVKGETAWSIARAHGISAKQLYADNGMRYNATLYPGQMLDVPR